MKMFKKIAAAFLTIAMAVTMFVSAYSVSAAGIASTMLTDNQRKVYDELVKTYITEFSYGSTTSFKFWFKDQFAFDETEAEVTTTDIFLAVSMFVADYNHQLPWIDYEGAVMEEYPVPFVGASVNTMESIGVDLDLIVAMFAVKEEYQGNVSELFGYQNITIEDNAEKDYSNSANLALGKEVTVDSTVVDGNSGEERTDLGKDYVNDGDYATRWQTNTNVSATTPAWVYVDLGEAKQFDKVRLYWETARADKDGFVIQYSDDAEAWTDATFVSKTRSEVSMAGNNEHFDDVVIEPVTARYVRVYVTNYEKLATVSLYEFEIYNGEIPEPEATVTGIEVTKAPDKTTYYAGTYPYADLTGMELTVNYSDNTSEVIAGEELEALRGYGSTDLLFAFVDDYSSSVSISYLGFETNTPVEIIEDTVLVSMIEVVSAPTGEGLRGIVFNAYNEDFSGYTELTISEDAEPVQSTEMMGIAVETYVVEYEGEDYLAIGLFYEGGGMLEGILGMGETEELSEEGTEEVAPEEGTEEGDSDLSENSFSVIVFMGCLAMTEPYDFIEVTLTLTEDSTYALYEDGGYVTNIPEGTTVADFKTNFVEEVQLTDIEGNVYADEALVENDMWVMVLVDGEYVDSYYTTLLEGSEPPAIIEWTLTLTDDSTYALDKEFLYVCDVPAGVTVADFKANFVEEIQLVDDDGNVIADDALVGTGMWIQILVGEEYIDTLYEVTVNGDLNGDGQVNSTDFMRIRRNFLGIYEFEDYLESVVADTNSDGEINSTDFMRVRRHFLGTFDLYSAE